MYGLLIESIVEFIKRRYGNATWDTIRKKAKLDNSLFSTHQQYSETLFIRIMRCLADTTSKPTGENICSKSVGLVNPHF